MKKPFSRLLYLSYLLATCTAQAQTIPIALHTQNPHYFTYQGKTTALITSGEHYGAVLNLDFDYKKYLQTLADEGMNYTRIFTGTYYEIVGDFNIEKNNLAPKRDRYIGPWPEAERDKSKFDLSKWNEAYFARLKNFLSEAGKHGIMLVKNDWQTKADFADEASLAWQSAVANTISQTEQKRNRP